MSQTVDGIELRRGTVVSNDGDELRMYGPVDGDLEWASVTTILDARDDADDYSGFRSYFDGSGDKPHWSEILDYKSWRGTLAHYKALDPLADRDLRGSEEYHAYQSLKGWEYQHEDALSQARSEVEWALDAFTDLAETWDIAEYNDDGQVVDKHGIRAVEQYVVDDDIGYAGQLDLAWDREDTTTMVGDVKTSKASDVSNLISKKFPRYGMQLAAYAHAASFDVDEAAIIWMAPDTKEAAVIPESQWPRSREDYEREFRDVAETVHQQTLDDFEPANDGYDEDGASRHG